MLTIAFRVLNCHFDTATMYVMICRLSDCDRDVVNRDRRCAQRGVPRYLGLIMMGRRSDSTYINGHFLGIWVAGSAPTKIGTSQAFGCRCGGIPLPNIYCSYLGLSKP